MPRFAVIGVVTSLMLCGGASAALAQNVAQPSVPTSSHRMHPEPRSTHDAPLLTIEELESLCSVESSRPGNGAADDARVVLDIQSLDSDLDKELTSSLSAKDGQTCKESAAVIRNLVAQRQASTRTLCDLRQVFGVSTSARLLADTANLRSALDRDLEVAESGSLRDCLSAVADVRQNLDDWKAMANQACMLGPSQAAILACGRLSGDVEIQKSASAVCRAYAEDDVIPGPAAAMVSRCVRIHDQRRDLRQSSLGSGEFSPEDDRSPLAGAALQTAILRGAAEFFVSRAEQELSLFASEAAGRRLCEPNTISSSFLANTCPLLRTDDTDGVSLLATPSAIREAVRLDFEMLPTLLADKLGRGERTPLACATAVGWSFAEAAVGGDAIADLIADPSGVLAGGLATQHCTDKMLETVKKACGEVGKLLGSRQDSARLVRAAKFNTLISLGAPDLVQGEGLTEFGELAKAVLQRLRRLDRVASAYHASPSAEARVATLEAGLGAVEPILLYLVMQYGSTPETTSDLHTVVTLEAQILNRRYAAAVLALTQLNTVAALREAKARNLLGLAAALAEGSSSDDVRSVLKDASLPLGSWRRKNEARLGITLTTWVGASFGYEMVRDRTANGGKVSSGSSVAPVVMFGVDVHRGLGSGMRLGLGLSVLDLGALGALRLDQPTVSGAKANDSASAQPNVRLEQVFAPGLFPYLGFGPISLGVGAHFVPSLRQSEDPVGHVRPLNVLRLGAMLTVDVSLLPLL